MKKLVIASLLALGTLSAQAQHYGHHGYHHGHRGGYYGGWGWAGPALIGGIIGYELSRQRPLVVEQPQVVIQQPPVIVQQPPVIIQQPQGTPAQGTPNNCTPVYTAQGQLYGCIQ